MGLRPAKCYRHIERAYTRKSRKRSKDYVKGIPESKIHRFELGDPRRKFELTYNLIATTSVQIRHNALEAARVSLSKNLEKRVGKDAFFLKVLVFPHHVLRENILATGAGADRFQTGMSQSFGKPIGIAAQIKKGQAVLQIRFDKAGLEGAKKSLKIASSKLPTHCRIAPVAQAA